MSDRHFAIPARLTLAITVFDCATMKDPMISAEALGVTPPGLELVYVSTGQLREPVELGDMPEGARRMVPILAGSVNGPLIQGEVLPGADWQLTRIDGVVLVDATYVIRTIDDVFLQVRNVGIRHAPPDVSAALARGEDVSPHDYYFRTAPTFSAPRGRYDWLNRTLFIASGARRRRAIQLAVWRVT